MAGSAKVPLVLENALDGIAGTPRDLAGEVLVSSTVRDLVAGSGIRFTDRGIAALNGVPGE
jgi:hypothetical protein